MPRHRPPWRSTRILNDLKIRYYEVLGAQESLAVTERLVKIAERSLAIAEKRMEGIHGTKTDLLQARVQLETVQLLREEAENRYLGAWERLTTMSGATWLKPVRITEDLADNIPDLDFDSSMQRLTNSPQLRSTECDLSHAWATYRESRAQAMPNVTFQAVGEYDQAMQASILTTLIAMPIPLINRNQGNIDKASADIVAAQAEISRVQLLQKEHLSDTFQTYKDNRRKAERLRTVILPSSEENLKLTQQVFESGEIGFAQVLAAQQSNFHSQLEYVTALTEVHKAAASIEGYLLTGGLNPAAIGSAIQNQPGGGAQRQRALLGEMNDKSSKQLLPAAQISQ
jgi:cobalt-zinc-cadmium efflux system outer membrane protein